MRKETLPQAEGANIQASEAARDEPGQPEEAGAIPWVLLPVLTVLAYLPAMRAGIVWDDALYLFSNKLIHSAGGLFRIWFTTESQIYYPLTWSSFWLEWRLWGNHPAGYHGVNILLHALNAFLLWRLFLQLRLRGAWLAAAVFALHPINVPSVAWIIERKNTLSLLFLLLCLRSYLHGEGGTWKRHHLYSLCFYLLALLSKSSVVMLPWVLLLHAWWERKLPVRTALAASLPFFGLSALFGAITLWFEHFYNVIDVTKVLPEGLVWRLANCGWSLWFYLGKLLIPVQLSMVYPRRELDIHQVATWTPLFLCVAVAVALFLCRRFRWAQHCLFGIGSSVLLLLPLLGLIPTGFFRFGMVADHWMYVPAIGVIGLGVSGTFTGMEKWGRRGWLRCLGAFLIVLLFAGTWNRAAVFRNEETLWLDTLSKNPRCWIGHYNLASFYQERGRRASAIRHLEQAIKIKPDFLQGLNNLAALLMEAGQGARAIRYLERALEVEPAPNMVHNLANIFRDSGQMERAVNGYARALELDPGYYPSLLNLAWIRAASEEQKFRDGSKAVGLAKRALEAAGPNDIRALEALAAGHAENGEFEQAISVEERAEKAAAAAGQEGLVSQIHERLEAYRRKQPFRKMWARPKH